MIMHRFHKELNFKSYGFPDAKFEAYGTGTPLRQFLYADDFANIILKLLFDYNGSERNIYAAMIMNGQLKKLFIN